MTVDRRNLVARSLAALDDEGSIETRPLAEIKVDLEALGIDPRGSIQAAHARARERTSPADQLLARLAEADAISADIDALETADIDGIKNDIPKAMAASAAADAKRRAGVPSNVTSLRRKRPSRHFWGWGGSMVGFAACLLLFFVTRPDQLNQIEPPSMEAPSTEDIDEVGAHSRSAVLADTELDQTLEEIRESLEFAEEMAIAADELAPTARKGQEVPAPASVQPLKSRTIERESAAVRTKNLSVVENEPGSPETEREPDQTLREGEIESLQDVSTAAAVPATAQTPSHRPAMKPSVPSHQPMLKPSTPSRESDANKLVTAERHLARTRVQLANDDPNSDERQELMTRWGELSALLLLDPNAAPPELKALAGNLPEHRLFDRLDEAQSFLGHRPVIALMTVLRDGDEVDVVVTQKENGNRIDLLNSLTEQADSTDPGVEIIDLPRSP